MISRRNIRIKVMQNLYALRSQSEDGDEELKKKINQAKKNTLNSIEVSGQILIHLFYILIKVAEFAEKDADKRASKKLPTEEDLHVSTKITHNFYIRLLKQNESFQKAVKDFHLESKTDTDLIKLLYHRLSKSEAYKDYTQEEQSNPKAEKEILLALCDEILFGDDDFEQFMEDLYLQWDDDEVMMHMLLVNYFNNPDAFDFDHLITEEKREYALELTSTAIEKQAYCMELIRPRLKNWDPERVALIDMILLNMGVCEFLFFPSIPPRATINEYIDLAKDYSTPQSGQFINGVLDNILKSLKKDKKLNKTERALK